MNGLRLDDAQWGDLDPCNPWVSVNMNDQPAWPLPANAPVFAGIMGDVHANIPWVTSQIPRICKRLPPPRIILQAGDFGVWEPPGNQSFLSAVDQVLRDCDAELWFVDGNHEDHEYLNKTRASVETPWLTSRIQWLERGRRWTWHGKTWLALGGAVSVDKNFRTEGVDWFPEEEITAEQEAAACWGQADVLLSHDAPTEEPLWLPPPPPEWLPMIARAEAHRDVLQRVCEAVRPSWVFHGHYHREKFSRVETRWGPCSFQSLDADGTQGNWGILDTRTMEWQW